MYPNSDAIAKIESRSLRVALYTSEGEDRKRLEAAFPECYTDDLEKICVPTSILIMDTAVVLNNEIGPLWEIAHECEYSWQWSLERIGVPIAYEWSDPDGNTTENPVAIPQEVWKQLLGQPLRSGITVEYEGRKLVLADYLNGEEAIGLPITMLHKGYCLVFVDAKYIDLNDAYDPNE